MHLARDIEPADAFALIARACLVHITVNIHSLRVRYDPESVHQVRVGIRRLRAAISSFRDVLSDAWRPRLGRELRWLQRELAAAREWDVFMADVLSPASRAEREGRGAGLRRLPNIGASRPTHEPARYCTADAARGCSSILRQR